MKSKINFQDPSSKYLLKISENYSIEEREKLLGPSRQASRYPVFKDAGSLWTFNYKAEESKRFKGLGLWSPPLNVPNREIDRYLGRCYQRWPKSSGMNEEIALRLLMLNDYDIVKTLALVESSNMGASYEIVNLINKMTSSDPKIEMIGYLIKLSEKQDK